MRLYLLKFFIFVVLSEVLFSGSLEARLYFMHVPKTGGTTLRFLLELQLSSDEIYPFRNCKSAAGPVTENLVSGHFPYWFCKNLDDDFEDAFKVTILRDPVDRYLSFLRAKKKADIELPDLESVIKLRLLPDNKYREGLIDNAICRYLSGDPLLEGEALLESAKFTLKEVDCVVFFDHFAQDIIDLFGRFEIGLKKEDIPKINMTEREPVSLELLEEVRQLNELDIQLYEYAKNHLSQKNTQYPLRTSSFENIEKKTSFVDYTFDLPLQGRGWTYRETGDCETIDDPVYRWVMDHSADIYFSLIEGSDYFVFFNARPLTDEVVPRVNVNGKEIEIVRLNTGLFSLYKGLIPKNYITQHPTELSFYSSRAFQYRDLYPSHYNRNHPPLSFAVNRIQIWPCCQQF